MKTYVYVVVAIVAAVISILAVFILVPISVKKVNSLEVGVAYDTVAKHLDAEVRGGGLYTGAPGLKFIIFPDVFRSIEYSELKCLGGDGIRVSLKTSFQYKVQRDNVHDVILTYKDHDTFESILSLVAQSAIMDACSMFNISEFQSRRGDFTYQAEELIRERLTHLDVDVSNLQISNINRPDKYEHAVELKEAAREKITVAQQNRERLLIQQMTAKDVAEKDAQITIQNAQSNSRVVLNSARKAADGIAFEFQQEALTYRTIMDNNNFDADALLSYLGIQTVAQAENDVHIGLESPAKSRFTNL